MQHFLKIIFISVCLCTTAWAQNQSPSDSEARAIVSTYLNALGQGDTLTIKQLLGGSILQQRHKILDNPSYPNMLSKRYSLATSSIVRTEQINPYNVAVDTLIELNAQETLQCRFIVTRDDDQQIKIIQEQTHN